MSCLFCFLKNYLLACTFYYTSFCRYYFIDIEAVLTSSNRKDLHQPAQYLDSTKQKPCSHEMVLCFDLTGYYFVQAGYWFDDTESCFTLKRILFSLNRVLFIWNGVLFCQHRVIIWWNHILFWQNSVLFCWNRVLFQWNRVLFQWIGYCFNK